MRGRNRKRGSDGFPVRGLVWDTIAKKVMRTLAGKGKQVVGLSDKKKRKRKGKKSGKDPMQLLFDMMMDGSGCAQSEQVAYATVTVSYRTYRVYEGKVRGAGLEWTKLEDQRATAPELRLQRGVRGRLQGKQTRTGQSVREHHHASPCMPFWKRRRHQPGKRCTRLIECHVSARQAEPDGHGGRKLLDLHFTNEI